MLYGLRYVCSFRYLLVKRCSGVDCSLTSVTDRLTLLAAAPGFGTASGFSIVYYTRHFLSLFMN